MKIMTQSEHALSEIVSVILIAFLVIVVALFITMALTGVLTKMLNTPALVVVTASPITTSAGTHIIQLNHKEGNPVMVKGTPYAKGDSIIEIVLVDESGSYSLAGTGMTRESWGPGNYLYIVSSGTGGYELTETPTGTIGSGDYKIRIIDTKTNVLLHTLNATIQ